MMVLRVLAYGTAERDDENGARGNNETETLKKEKIDAMRKETDARGNETDARRNENDARGNETDARRNDSLHSWQVLHQSRHLIIHAELVSSEPGNENDVEPGNDGDPAEVFGQPRLELYTNVVADHDNNQQLIPALDSTESDLAPRLPLVDFVNNERYLPNHIY
jgi:hypothetical protein